MQNQLIEEESILAIQEAMCGFIVEQVLDEKGEFYYDGMSNLDHRVNMITLGKTFVALCM